VTKPCYACGTDVEVRELPRTPHRVCPNKKCRVPMDRAAVDATYFEPECREQLREQAYAEVDAMWAEPAPPATTDGQATDNAAGADGAGFYHPPA